MAKLTAALAALALALAASACGSDDGDDETAPAQRRNDPALAAFVARGDAICREAIDELIGINQELAVLREQSQSEAVDTRKVAELLSDGRAIQREALSRFERLRLPPQVPEAAAYVEAVRDQVALLSDLVEATRDRDRSAIERANEALGDANGRLRENARAVGFETCGRAQP